MGVFKNMPADRPAKRYGYQILRHPSPELFAGLKRRFEDLLSSRLAEFSGKRVEGFRAEEYHRVVEELGVDHHAFIRKYRRELPKDWLTDPHLLKLLDAAGAVVGRKLRIYNDVLEFRVCRPHQKDNNPWHRDHWFPYFDPLMNVYLPISGSYVDSALQVVPFSHEWSDEDVRPTFEYGQGKKTDKNGILYSVPEIASSRHEIRGHRPDVLPGDFMIFSPRIVHGSGDNTGTQTRFSFEFRLELVPPA